MVKMIPRLYYIAWKGSLKKKGNEKKSRNLGNNT